MKIDKHPSILFFCLLAAILSSCAKKHNCPGFSESLAPYIPQENRMVFSNAQGDSLRIDISSYSKSEPYVAQKNIYRYETKTPSCSASCSMNGYLSSGQNQSFSYYIRSNEQSDSCTIDLTLFNDYFHQTVACSASSRPFGDTLRLDLYNSAVSYSRFDKVEIVYGRGITKLHDFTIGVDWYR